MILYSQAISLIRKFDYVEVLRLMVRNLDYISVNMKKTSRKGYETAARASPTIPDEAAFAILDEMHQRGVLSRAVRQVTTAQATSIMLWAAKHISNSPNHAAVAIETVSEIVAALTSTPSSSSSANDQESQSVTSDGRIGTEIFTKLRAVLDVITNELTVQTNLMPLLGLTELVMTLPNNHQKKDHQVLSAGDNKTVNVCDDDSDDEEI
jgi:hypothetical protein